MATDKRLDQVSQLTDFDYALIVKGTDVAKVTKQQFAELVGNFLYGATTKETLASVVAEQIGFRKTGNLISDAGALVQLSYGTKVALGEKKGRYAVYIGYTGGRCAVDYDGSNLTTVYDDTYDWAKIGTSPYEGSLNIYIENGKVTVDYRRKEATALSYIYC